MAARKKKSTKKKSVKKKKAGVVKKAATRKKKSSSTKKVKKTSVARKKVVSSKKTKKKSASGTTKKKQPASRTKASPVASSGAKKARIFSKKFNIGTAVQATSGRFVGQTGVVVRQDPYLCTFFIAFDNCQNDPYYKNIEWGPYFESELALVKKSKR